MRLGNKGMTLMEIIVVLVIIGICAAVVLPNFNTPQEQAYATSAQSDLMAIYSAQQNYRNNNGSYATLPSGTHIGVPPNTTTDTDGVQVINNTLFLNIQDTGLYTYSCALPPVCTATRMRNNLPSDPTITVTLNSPTVKGTNPKCASSSNPGWCPF